MRNFESASRDGSEKYPQDEVSNLCVVPTFFVRFLRNLWNSEKPGHVGNHWNRIDVPCSKKQFLGTFMQN